MAAERRAERDLDLFGGSTPWRSSGWTSSDDRVRGGKSQSYLDCPADGSLAHFYGTLDTETLGGAGFASQRTVATDRQWDLSGYDGIRLRLGDHDSKRYTFNLKDQLLPPDPETGREQSSVSYEYDFVLGSAVNSTSPTEILIPWSSFNPTYRGRPQKDARPIDTTVVRRFSFMMRSFFDQQKGDFSLTILSVSAYTTEGSAVSKYENCSKTGYESTVDVSEKPLSKPLPNHGTRNVAGRIMRFFSSCFHK